MEKSMRFLTDRSVARLFVLAVCLSLTPGVWAGDWPYVGPVPETTGGDDPPPPCESGNSCESACPGDGPDAGGNPGSPGGPPTESDGPVRYHDGRAKLVYEDIPDPMGTPWFGHTRTFWNNAKWPSTSNSVGHNGMQWFVQQWPYLVESADGHLVAELPGIGAYWFEDDGSGNYTVTPHQDDVTLTAQNLDAGLDADAGELVLTVGDDRVVFRDLGGTNGLSTYSGCLNAPRRAFKRYEAPSGLKVEVVSYSSNGGRFLELQRTLPSPDNDLIHSMVYTWVTATPPSGSPDPDLQWLDKVELRESRNGQVGPWTSVRRSSYEYTTTGGNGDLHRVTLQKPDGSGGWTDIGKHYYLYYLDSHLVSGSGPGSEIHAYRMMALAIAPDGYRRYMDDNGGSEPTMYLDGMIYSLGPIGTDPFWRAEVTEGLLPYSEYYFEYNEDSYGNVGVTDPLYGTVKKEIAAANCTTCSVTGSLVGGDEFEYFINPSYPASPTDPYNSWERRTIVTHADGSKECVFTTEFGQVILKVYEDPDASPVRRWGEYWRYDSENRMILAGSPASLDLSSLPADLSTWQPALDVVDDGGTNDLLRASTGKVDVTSYYTTTTATQSTAGGHKGAVKYRAVKEGYSGTEVRTVEYEYYSYSLGATKVVAPVAKMIAYPIAGNLTTKIETSYTYTYHPSSTAIATKTTTLPAIGTAQNGSGTAATIEEVFDIYGRRTWIKDERDVITRYIYDNLIGSVVQMIEDVDTSITTDEPSGWSTPGSTGFGNHVVTDYSYDGLGRRIETLGPVHTVDLNGVTSRGDTSIRPANWMVYVENGIDVLNELRSASGYATGSPGSYTYELVNPVSIRKTGKDGWAKIYDRIQAKRASTSGKITESDTFTQSDYTAWIHNEYSDGNQVTESRAYHTIPSSGDGVSGANYDTTSYEYDLDNGNQIKVLSPDGTITRTVYGDLVGEEVVASTWIGTDDTAATADDPSGAGSGSNNMVKGVSYEYDGGASGGGGNGHLTRVTQEVDGVGTRVTTYGYDWRDRRTSEDGEVDVYTEYTYDNLGRLTQLDRKDTTSGGNLIARRQTKYDDRNRIYQTITYGVDPSTGTVGNSLNDKTWYDAAGYVIKHQPPGQRFTKSIYDGLGRLVESYDGYDTDETGYADADDVAGDTVLLQTEYVYDKASNLLNVTAYNRNHDESGSTTGELTGSIARLTYRAFWYDGANRQTVGADYGTNGGSAFNRLATAPVAADDILVSVTEYDDAGRADTFTDPEGIVTKVFFDDAGRQTHVVENYVSTGWVFKPSMPGVRDADVNRVTAYTYTPDGQIATLTAVDPDHDAYTSEPGSGGNQVTTYVYGTTLTDSDLASNRLLRAVIYPDSDDAPGSNPGDPIGDGTDGVYDRVELTYNRLGQPVTRKDQRETVHTYEYDGLGRLLHDRITDLGRSGEAVDNAVLRVTRAYEVRGMLTSTTSYDNATPGSGSIVNETINAYNDFGQLISDHQEHSGAKDANTPAVTYGYEDGSDTTKMVRRTKTTYPNGRIIHTVYDGHGGIDDAISRANALADDNGSGSAGDAIATYSYLGSSRTVIKDYPLPDLRLDYIGSPSGGDGGYANLDRFGRVTTHLWEDYSAGAGNEVDVFHIAHGYDRASNRLYADRQVYESYSEDYDYDGLHRLTGYEQGRFAPGSESSGGAIEDHWKLRDRDWTLDQVGNQTAVADYGITWRTDAFNAANEYSSTTGSRKARADQGPPEVPMQDFFATDTSTNYTKPGSGDAFSVSGGVLTFTTVANDAIENEDRALVVTGEDIGPNQAAVQIKFPAGTSTGYAGVVFGYQSENDYWMVVFDIGAQQRYLYHVVNGDKGAALDSVSTTLAADTDYWVYPRLDRRAEQLFAYGIAGGAPSGKVGLVTSVADVEFDQFRVPADEVVTDLAGRWDNNSSHNSDVVNYLGADRLHLTGSWNAYYRPKLLRGVRAGDRFRVTFNAIKANSSNRNLWFVFNAKDNDDYDFIDINLRESSSTQKAPAGYTVDDGQTRAWVTGTRTNTSMPYVDKDQLVWVRVEADGTNVTVKAAQQTNEPSDWSAVATCFTSANFDLDGGRLGFTVGTWIYVDDVTVETDRDANGSYETTEAVEGFEMDANGYAQETLTHDAAGNLTYDGVYQFAYDAWNRLVKVTKAYRDPASPSTVSLGSVVQESEYDGQGRRIVKAVKNSGALDATYHYYYRGMSVVEVRNGSDNVLKQHVWGLTYIDELVQTALNDDPADVTEDDVESFYYALQDAHFNVLGMTDATGVLTERYEYTPYGERTVYFSPGSNDPDAMAPTAISRRWTVGSTAQPYGLNDIGHQGLMHDEETGLVYNRARMLSPRLGRFTQRDLLGIDYYQSAAGDGYQDGMSLYQYTSSNPTLLHDPSGLTVVRIGCPSHFVRECHRICGRRNQVGFYSCFLIVEVGHKIGICDCRDTTKDPGHCTRRTHTLLQSQVKLKCDGVRRRCFGGQHCDATKANVSKNIDCARAREQMNRVCYKGINDTHRIAASEARAAAAKCQRLIPKNCDTQACNQPPRPPTCPAKGCSQTPIPAIS